MMDRIDTSDPLVLALMAGAAVVLLIVVLLFVGLRRAGQSAQMTAILAQQMASIGGRVQALSDGQQQLFGGLSAVSDAQAQSQTRTLALMEARLAEVARGMTESLQGSATRTARRPFVRVA